MCKWLTETCFFLRDRQDLTFDNRQMFRFRHTVKHQTEYVKDGSLFQFYDGHDTSMVLMDLNVQVHRNWRKSKCYLKRNLSHF